MEILKDKSKRNGFLATLLIHIGLLFLFAFFGLQYMDPPPEEEGISINFGTSDQGMFDIQNENPSENPENQPSEQVISEPTPTEVVEEELITQDVEEAASINKPKEVVEEVVKKPKKKEEPKPDKNLSDALNKWKEKSSEQGGGDGQTGEAGDQGALDGDKESRNYIGGGSGNGTSFSLSGRSMLSSPKIKDDSQEEGKVVVDIIVDKYGKVLRASPGARGSTTTNSLLYKKAKEAALQSKFDANPNAAEEQKGQMTFIFILN